MIGYDPFILVASAYDLKRTAAVTHILGMNPIPAQACLRILQHYPYQYEPLRMDLTKHGLNPMFIKHVTSQASNSIEREE